MKKWSLIVFVMITVFSSLAAQESSLLVNPSFEEAYKGKPSGWTINYWDKQPGQTLFEVLSGGAMDGDNYLKITNKIPNDSRILQNVSVSPNSKYKISCWIKTLNIGSAAKGANISLYGELETSRDLRGTHKEWTPLELYLETGKGITSINLCIGIGGYGSVNKGEISVDNINMERIDKFPPQVPIMRVAAKGVTQAANTNQLTLPPETVLEHIQTLLGFNKEGTSLAKGKKVPSIIYILAGIISGLILFIVIFLYKKNKEKEVPASPE